MALTKEEAALRLQDVEKVQRESQTLFQYQLASPHFVLWGVLWIIAGVIGALSPNHAGIGWIVVDGVGLVGSCYLVTNQVQRSGESGLRILMYRYLATIAVLVAFVTLTLIIFAPVAPVEVQTFITMLVAASYMIAGCWWGYRYAVVGAGLVIFASGSFFLAPVHVPLITALLGGSALVLGGFWMWRSE